MRSLSLSRCAVKLTFLDDAFVRLAGALDAILAIVALGREQLHDLEDAAHATATIGTGREMDRLTDLELVFAQRVLPDGKKVRRPAAMAGVENLVL
jgi:hypothetical protein